MQPTAGGMLTSNRISNKPNLQFSMRKPAWDSMQDGASDLMHVQKQSDMANTQRAFCRWYYMEPLRSGKSLKSFLMHLPFSVVIVQSLMRLQCNVRRSPQQQQHSMLVETPVQSIWPLQGPLQGP